jgi:hypothetical protein
MSGHPEPSLIDLDVERKRLVVAGGRDAWTVRFDDRELRGRSVVSLLEEVLGVRHRQLIHVALDALVHEANGSLSSRRSRPPPL